MMIKRGYKFIANFLSLSNRPDDDDDENSNLVPSLKILSY